VEHLRRSSSCCITPGWRPLTRTDPGLDHVQRLRRRGKSSRRKRRTSRKSEAWTAPKLPTLRNHNEPSPPPPKPYAADVAHRPAQGQLAEQAPPWVEMIEARTPKVFHKQGCLIPTGAKQGSIHHLIASRFGFCYRNEHVCSRLFLK